MCGRKQIEKDSRLSWVDLAKGIGIISVMMSHAGVGSSWIYTYYIPMFAALSGITYYYNHRMAEYCIKSSKKTALLYFKYSVLIFCLNIPLVLIENEKDYNIYFLKETFGIIYGRKSFNFPYDKVSNEILMNIGNGPLWYLCFLALSWLLVYVIFVYLDKKSDNNRIDKALFICNILLLYYLLTWLFSLSKYLLPWSIDTATIGAMFIFTGYFLEKIAHSDKVSYFRHKVSQKILGGVGTAELLLLVNMAFVYKLLLNKIAPYWNLAVRSYSCGISKNPLFLLFFCLYGTIMFFYFCKVVSKYKYPTKIFCICGKNSIYLLSFHQLIYNYLIHFEKRYLIKINPYIKVLLTLTIILLMAKCVSHVEKCRHKIANK